MRRQVEAARLGLAQARAGRVAARSLSKGRKTRAFRHPASRNLSHGGPPDACKARDQADFLGRIPAFFKL